MKFSLFFEMQLADPTPEKEAILFHNCVEQAKLADDLGYHCIWEVEHHGLYEYSHSSAPEVFLGYIAGQTKRIRLGHGCTLLPHRYNHPIRIAERIATLDILSNGRVNWGSAKSGTRVEREAFGVDSEAIHGEWLEALEIIPKMWAADVFSHKGRYFDIPETCIVPKPVQKPHPPMFAACSKPEQAIAIGKLGIGALNLATYHDEMLGERVSDYRKAIAQATPVGKVINNHFACNAAAFVLKDDLSACRHGLRGATYFLRSMVHYYGAERPSGRINISRDFLPDEQLERFRKARNTPSSQLSAVIGDPASARETVQRFVNIGVDELILVMQTGTTPHELTMESIRTFGEEVLPYFSA
ncbi:LLM class flavin-dependent oxidoreductase [Granulicella mallensis]|jgi:alkanesulfonate monooxygenase SsuD/methylene tetrahydromethanopterin reductase-like flavin-dependent oxidoreductase (luciferase family)|uniref:Alkanesulfonate monooxygenase SsuD/methylene tetrahydromethanopterin reductase-like flavin-dependent oxidoreductase (Luciferase family) n=1 Tax=Granulicella mallensis TaxID=940614 RepID=A0A7W8E8H1_9BACT|nr:LLM class flavin-dependent oxidoreductase [Granulicella mallensis]MBB5062626.1 alkanesulfonate monooxygenase SsuD/methylene tetrahydromethanopterin reductase-like flavin-dependent oxidoreductase (luciferase family) [Granulicella mallensis]